AWSAGGKSPTICAGGSSVAEAGATSERVVTAAAPIHPELRAALDVLTAWIDYRIAYLSLPGMAVAVARDQELVWSRRFRLADLHAGPAALRLGPPPAPGPPLRRRLRAQALPPRRRHAASRRGQARSR